MSAGITRSCLAGARICGLCLWTAAVWTTWLALAILLGFQGYIASVHELEVPRFLLREIEAHLAESGVSVRFGRATFDPSGRILIENARFKLASFTEPVVTASAIYVRLDPWALLARDFEPREIRATGADLFIPAMLSDSGRPEKIISDLDAGFSITSRGDEFSVDYFNCHVAGISLSAHGTINAGTVARDRGAGPSLPLAEFLSKNYVNLSREFSRAEERMSVLDQAVVTAVLIPSDTRGALVDMDLKAKGLRILGPVPVEATEVRAAGRFPLLGGAPLMASASASAEGLQVGNRATASGVRARIRGILKVDTLEFSPRQLELTAGAVSAGDADLVAPIARLSPGGDNRVVAEVSAWLYGRPVWTRTAFSLAAKTADIAFDGSFSPRVLDPISKRLGLPLRSFANPSEPVGLSGRVRLGTGWRLADARGRMDGRNIVAYGVKLDECRCSFAYDGIHLAVTDAVARSGENLALGSYVQDFSTLDFRYLLGGRLRPLDISPWFKGGWWENIFGNFGFPGGPPEATVDVRGRYRHGRVFSVFGYGDSTGAVLKGVPVDRVRTLLYVDQNQCDGLEVVATRGAGSIQGSFKVTFEPTAGVWEGLDLDLTSTFDPGSFAGVLPDGATEAIRAFTFGRPPSLAVQGHFDGPATQGERHKTLHMVMRSGGDLQVHGVAFSRATFTCDLLDDALDVRDIEAGFAGGVATGFARLWGPDGDRHLKFKAALTGASLGQSAALAEGYVTARAAGGSTALDAFARDKSDVRLDLNTSAEGRPGDLASFVGEGNLQIQGAGLGQLSMLGGLSRLLKVTELRFTQARAEFSIANASLVFPDLSVIGANSAIKAKGTYAIDRRQLDFTARIYPFQDSKSLLQVLNALTSPLSAVFAIRLTGSMDKPTWSIHPLYSPPSLPKAGEGTSPAPDKSSAPAPAAAQANPHP